MLPPLPLPLLLLLLSACLPVARGLDNGLGRTPPMGFNTWNHFGCVPLQPGGSFLPGGPSEALMKAQADAMVSSGMAKAGYTHVNIDDCWCASAPGPQPAQLCQLCQPQSLTFASFGAALGRLGAPHAGSSRTGPGRGRTRNPGRSPTRPGFRTA